MALEVVGSNPTTHPSIAKSFDFALFLSVIIGESSSGKTQHFDCCMRGFESRLPSQKITVIWIQITVIFNEVAPCGANEDASLMKK